MAAGYPFAFNEAHATEITLVNAFCSSQQDGIYFNSTTSGFTLHMDLGRVVATVYGLNLNGPGFVYCQAKLISGDFTSVLSASNITLSVEELQTKRTFIEHSLHESNISCLRYRDNGITGSNYLINCSSGKLILDGGYLKTGSGAPGTLHHVGGRMLLHDMVIDTSAPNVICVRVENTGLLVRNCAFFSGSGSFSLYSTSAREVQFYGPSCGDNGTSGVTQTPASSLTATSGLLPP
jgi:hypothetical protein